MCRWCRHQGLAKLIWNSHRCINCRDHLNPGSRHFNPLAAFVVGGVPAVVVGGGVFCSFCNMTNHAESNCRNSQNPNGKAALAARGGRGAPIGGHRKWCNYCHGAGMAPGAPPHDTRRCDDLANPNGKAALAAKGGQLVMAGGGAHNFQPQVVQVGGGGGAHTQVRVSADLQTIWFYGVSYPIIGTKNVRGKTMVTFGHPGDVIHETQLP